MEWTELTLLPELAQLAYTSACHIASAIEKWSLFY